MYSEKNDKLYMEWEEKYGDMNLVDIKEEDEEAWYYFIENMTDDDLQCEDYEAFLERKISGSDF